MKFIIVKTKEQGLFISDNIEGKEYFTSSIPNLFFDEKKLVATFKKNWYNLSEIPKKIEKRSADKQKNKRYELKDGFPISELTPKVISYEEWDYESEIAGLYKYEFETIEGVLEPVEFEVELLAEENNFYVEIPKYKSTPSLITALTIHPGLHLDRPCSITGAELYKILRAYVKLNVNPKYATITSDYDFCLTVQKVISHEPVSYEVNVGKRKPKYETRYRTNRTVVIFETSPAGYSNYSTLKGIQAENQKELEEKIDNYLEEIITLINKPYIQCACCNGLGVTLE